MSAPGPRWILGVDAVSSTPGAALWRNGVPVAERARPGVANEAPARPGERLAGCVLGLLEDQGLVVEALSGVAVTVGPGSFTGIRVGLAIVHGLLQGTSVACAAVETCAAAREAGRLLAPDAMFGGPDPAVGNFEREKEAATVLIQLRKTDWFVQRMPGDEPRLANAVDAAIAVGDSRAFAIGVPPPGVDPTPLPRGLASAAAALGSEKLCQAGWPRMDTAERVRVLMPEYRRETYVTESRGA